MSAIADYITALITELMEESGIVVWYDPTGFYEKILCRIALPSLPVFQYEGSFFALRHAIEPYLGAMEKQAALIYVPLSRAATHYALIEAECAGCYLEPGHPERRFDTRLEHIAGQILKGVIPGQVESILSKIKAGEFGLDDIDRLAQAGYATPAAALNLIYDKMDPVDIFCEFLTRPDLDNKVIEKNSGNEILKLAVTVLGYAEEKPADLKQLRQKLLRWLLLNDFMSAFPQGKVPPQMQHIPQPAHNYERKNVFSLVDTLRQRRSAQNCYEEAACAVERTLPLTEMALDAEILLQAQTFSGLENLLLERLGRLLLDDEQTDAVRLLDLCDKRYWAQRPPWNLQWTWLALVQQLLAGAQAMQEELKRAPDTSAFIQAYCRDERPWHLFDRLFQDMEIRFHSLETSPVGWSDLFERLLVKARQNYSETIRLQAEAFQKAVQKSGFQAEGVLHQRKLFDERIAPLLQQCPVAFVQVDALRYDLAGRLAQMLPQNIQVQLEPAFGQLPGITAIGMAAALPGTAGLSALADSGKGKIGLRIGNQPLFTREERKKYLQQHVGEGPFYAVELEALQKPRKALREALPKSRFVWVTCQEIDALAENLNALVARGFIEKLLHDLRRGILALFELGIERIVIVADHGFLFGDEAAPGERIDAPGGQTALLHRRVWVGRGGSNHPSYLRVSEKEIDLAGDLELIFPAGVSIFKSPGGNLCFFHGGISLQEMVIPVMTLTAGASPKTTAGRQMVGLFLEKTTITNRVFLVRIKYQSSDLFAPERINVRLVLQSEGKPAGQVLLATPQPENRAAEIVLDKNQEVTVTCALLEQTAPERIELHLFDADSELLLAQITDIPIQLLN